MKRTNDQLPAEPARELREIIERDKAGALADFDTTAFAHRLRRRITAARPFRHPPSGHRLPRLLRPGALVAAALALVALVLWIAPSRAPRTDPEVIARALAGCTFFASDALDRPPGDAAGKSPPGPVRDLEWSIQALLYRAQCSSADDGPDKGDVARTILVALAGAPPEGHARWPSVDPDALARRIAALSRTGAFLRAFGEKR